MKIDTAIGEIDAALLQTVQRRQQTPAGELTTTEYRFEGAVVKIDQHLALSQDAMVASGDATL